jgi:serine/threonine-protein kinase
VACSERAVEEALIMGLATGSRIGPYEILTAIGAGGMGEVYRARDAKLNRDVAIKVLPDIFASDPERLARFEREAQVLASLNHPHIAHVYGVEESPSGGRALVMELVEGEDLAQRISRGALSVEDALGTAKQLVDALEAAHERGVIHRDLKPSNIKVRDDGTVKILDFGLAKALDPGALSHPSLMNSPTLTSPATMAGTILGTAAYMSPEQAKGKPVDKRADIWAFGVVLYEMLTGRHPFPGETTTEMLGAVVLKDVDWSLLPAATPPRVAGLLPRCLEKDPRQRLRDIGDARFDLNASSAAPAAVRRPRPRAAVLIAVAIAAAALAATITWLATRSAPAALTARRFALTGLKPLVYDAFQSLSLAPDGSVLAFRGRGADGIDRVFVRSLDGEETRPLAGTDGARLPFFSPDGQWVGFFAAGNLKKVPVGGGSAQIIAPARNATGATWMDDGSIVFVGDTSVGVQRVSSAGGNPETVLPIGGDVNTPSSPWALPGSRHILLLVRRGARFDLAMASLADRTVRVLAEDAFSPVWISSGHVLFSQETAIMAIPVDARSQQATGVAFPVMQGMGTRISYQSRLFAVADDGTLVYSPQEPAGQGGWSIASVDRKGQETRLAVLERQADSPRLSPDGSRIAFRTPASNCDVWVHDLKRGTTMRVTREGDNHGVVWNPDGTRIVVSRPQPSGTEILSLSADGSGDIQKLATFPPDSGAVPTSMAGGVVLVQNRFNTQGMDIVAIPAAGGAATPLLASPFDESSASLSRDGRLVAFVSNESGRNEVYVRPFSGQGGRISISTAGGTEPMWSPSGDELFYRSGHDMMSVTFAKGSPSRPQQLFSRENALGALGGLVTNYDAAGGGRTFVTLTGRQWKAEELAVVVNWFSGWKQSGSGARPGGH